MEFQLKPSVLNLNNKGNQQGCYALLGLLKKELL